LARPSRRHANPAIALLPREAAQLLGGNIVADRYGCAYSWPRCITMQQDTTAHFTTQQSQNIAGVGITNETRRESCLVWPSAQWGSHREALGGETRAQNRFRSKP
jgi:hypothetical protein